MQNRRTFASWLILPRIFRSWVLVTSSGNIN